MTRYVLADLGQVGDELNQRAAEVAGWLDGQSALASASISAHPGLAGAIAEVDLVCYRALLAAAVRLAAAAEALGACAKHIRGVDADLARYCRERR
ncbi:MAG TPA: hypothetical protein VGH99_00310 [Pseudonocardia sp.]